MAQAEDLVPHLPERIAGLGIIATNLWWSWNREARRLFRDIDEVLWHQTRHNAVEFLQRADPARLVECAGDPHLVTRYERVLDELRQALSREGTWFRTRHAEHADKTIAYFCAEFGLHNSVPIYSGGLGVLAGDHCKACSDLGIPLVGVGLLYQRGYFDQKVRPDGWQESIDEPINPATVPIVPVLDQSGSPYLVEILTGGRTLHVGAWRLLVGAIPIYLLDTNLEKNHPEDRTISQRLYSGGPEMRLRQEWVLGVGGVRLLRRLGISVGAWHANEGHATFMLFERLREYIGEGVPFEEAVRRVRSASIFTTHTPVAAGHDVFTRDQIEACAGAYWEGIGVQREEFFRLGRGPDGDGQFHMTAAAIRLSGYVNGVSSLHGQETRRIWQRLWPKKDVSAIPVRHVTNGVHLATWMANPIMELLDAHLGPDWGNRRDDPELWDRVLTIDPAALWSVHLGLKQRLLGYIREDARRRWRNQEHEPGQLVSGGVLLGMGALTIGFARRFATYKRADLIFRDPDRLRKLLVNPRRPVQVIFAGKAHPADEHGKRMLQRVFSFARDPSFEGRIAFLEDHEMHLEHRLVQSVDLWLNVPRVPMEASGTSGMKAALNGVPQLGTLDGWWAEGFTGWNGWAIPRAPADQADEQDALHLYTLLENEIVPMFFDRDARGVPLQWAERMRHAMREAGQRFTARTMVQRYVREYYLSILSGNPPPGDPPDG
ncbi:MAG TPA: alpha-glucan family phosphorylase [Gemmatimonadales bacterium]|nr:alpha-glucan family phosphorylase [Gemmatimonadales bacterium]